MRLHCLCRSNGTLLRSHCIQRESLINWNRLGAKDRSVVVANVIQFPKRVYLEQNYRAESIDTFHRNIFCRKLEEIAVFSR